MEKNIDYEINHIKVLDGIRALAIMIIVWFHFWQQSWIYHQIGFINLDFLPRYGFLFVDMLILLSSFCLFLPYARSMVYQEEIPNNKKFYINRIAKIIPSYLLSMIISIIIIIVTSKNISLSFFIKDTLMHLLFVHNLSIDTLLSSNYFTVLWTLGVEVQFYIFFPFIAKKFMKKPIVSYFSMVITGLVCTYVIKKNVTDANLSLYVNHTLTFISVYANGILASWLYVKYTKDKKRNIIKDLMFTFLSIVCIFIYRYLCLSIGNNLQRWQLDNRFLLSIVFAIFIVSTILSIKYYRKLFENRFMKFIAVISFNLYIYHQFIAVKLKELRIPFYIGDIPPNIKGDSKWQWTYFILCIVISVIVAIIMTYAVEKPLYKLIKKKFVDVK